jgi:histidine triad (HIT) family protein
MESSVRNDCLFCGIADGDVPSDQVFSDDLVVAFRDIAPRSPVHVLVIPRDHLVSAAELTEDHGALLGRIFSVAADVARREGIAGRGYRITTNIGTQGGQTVNHLHFHVMGGRPFTWPPG